MSERKANAGKEDALFAVVPVDSDRLKEEVRIGLQIAMCPQHLYQDKDSEDMLVHVMLTFYLQLGNL